MARLFTTLFDTPTHVVAPARRWVPAVDLVESTDHYSVKADLPGMSAADVVIDVTDGVLTLSGERSAEREVSEGGFMRIERATGSFARALTLPKGVDASRIAASFSDGVLEITVPKPEERKPHRVPISVGEPAAIEG